MANNYQQVINTATAQYNATLVGYQNTLRQQQAAQQGVMAGYNSLQANVLKGLENNSASAKQEIIDQYTAAAGKQQASMIGRGLGNTTIMDSALRGLGYDQAKAQTARMNQFANTAAGYQSQLGLAGLNYAGNAINANTQFAGQGLQYQGQGAMQIGQLGLGFAGLENQRAMQEAQIKAQRDQYTQRNGIGGGVTYGAGGSSPLGLNTNFGNGGGNMGPRQQFYNDPMVQDPRQRPQPYGGPPQTVYGAAESQPGDLGYAYGENASQFGSGGGTSDAWAGYAAGGDGWWYADGDSADNYA
jgi:hypothetical protein